MARKNQLLQQRLKMKRISIILALLFVIAGIAASAQQPQPTTKKERNFIKAGNKAYADSNFVKATEEFYRAYNINPNNDVTVYNIATSQMQTGFAIKQGNKSQSAGKGSDQAEKLISKADSIYSDLYNHSANKSIREKAAYNSGNIHFRNEDYQGSIEQYKNALRINPNNDNARHNLRLAQLKIKNQQDQNKNDQNDKNQDKDQDKQDQPQQQQDQQQQQQQQQNQDKQQQQQQQYSSQSISKENAEQILNAMENAERGTRQKVKAGQQNASRKIVTKPW
jgi:tetratricopeptide (TPR) repeat protein